MGKSAKNKKNRPAASVAPHGLSASIATTTANGTGPTTTTDTNGGQSQSQSQSSTTAAPVLSQLSALDSSDRAWAAASLAHLAVDPAVRPALIAGNAVGKLIMLLSDSPEVAVEAAGALRNIVLTDPAEDQDHHQQRKESTVEEVYRKDGMTPLLALVPKFQSFFASKLHLNVAHGAADGGEDGQENGMEGTGGEKLSRKQKKALKAAAAAVANGQPAPSSSSSEQKPPKKKQDDAKTVLELAEQALGLLWIMSERHPPAHKLASASPLPPLLLALLPLSPSLPPNLAIAAAQLLNVLVEENEIVLRQFAENMDWTDHLIDLLRLLASSEAASQTFHGYKPLDLQLLALHISSVIHGLSGIPGDPDKAIEAGDLALRAIASVLSQDLADSYRRAAEYASRPEPEIPEGLGADKRHVADASVNPVHAEWEAFKLALEVLSNLCSDPRDPVAGPVVASERSKEDGRNGKPGEEEWDDVEMDADDDEDIVEEANGDAAADDDDEEEGDDDDFPDDEDMAEVLGEQGTAAQVENDPLAVKIEKLGILASVRRLASASELLGQADPARLDEIEGLLEVQHRALGALNNILLAMDKPWFAKHGGELAGLWEWAFGVIQQSEAVALAVPAASATADEVRNATIGVMLALVRGLAPQNPAMLAEYQLPVATPSGAITKLISLRSPDLSPTLLPLLSMLAQRRPGHLTENLEIGRLFIAIATDPKSPVEEMVDALDGLFDIYAEGSWDYDRNWKGQGWLQVLRNAYGGIKARVKALDKRKIREVRERADLAVQNLKAFLDYKAQEAKA